MVKRAIALELHMKPLPESEKCIKIEIEKSQTWLFFGHERAITDTSQYSEEGQWEAFQKGERPFFSRAILFSHILHPPNHAHRSHP
eukprot:2873059-Amphidinium_carterae.2